MKKIIVYISFLIIIGFVACVKNDLKTFTDAPQAEIDLAAWNANGAGLTYPLITRIPAANRALTAGCPDSTLRRYAGTIQVRVNLIGAQSGNDETVGYKIFGTPVSTIAFPATIPANAGLGCATAQTPSAAAATLNVVDAVAGTHYTALSGKVTISKGSSFGYITIPILNAGATASQARFIGIELDATGSIKPAVNYGKVGLLIDQR